MKTALLKDIFREIKHSLPRFLSIGVMIFLGVFVYSGLKGAAPLMRNTIDDFTLKTNMADIKINASFGLDNKDISLILNSSDIASSEKIHAIDLNTLDSDALIQVQSMPKQISLPYLVEGRFPKNRDEILLDYSLKDKGYNIGNIIKFNKEVNKFNFQKEDKADVLEKYQFTIVGFCYHPDFTHPLVKGEASNGLGKLAGFAFVDNDNFTTEDYSFVRLKLKSVNNYSSNDSKYKELTANFKNKMESKLSIRPNIKLRDLKKIARDKIIENEQKLNEAHRKLDYAQSQLDHADIQITKAENKLQTQKAKLTVNTESANQKIKDAESKLNMAKINLDTGKTQLQTETQAYNQAKKEYDRAYSAFSKGKSKLNQQESSINSSLAKVQQGLYDIQKGLSEIDNAEKQILYQFSKFGISIETYKAKITAALNSNNQEIIKSMGEPAISYAKVLSEKEKLLTQKEVLTKQQKQLNKGLSLIYNEKSKLIEKEEQLNHAKAKLDNGALRLKQAKYKLKQGQIDYNNGLSELNDSRQQLASKTIDAQEQISAAEEKLQVARNKYEKNKEEFETKRDEANIKIADGKKKIKDAKKLINILKKPAYNVLTRNDLPGYFLYYDSSKRIELLSNIFPVFFFLIAMLVCLSTMTRMTEEHRGQIGTLKALGYNNWDIAKKYFYYGLFASLLGAGFGIALAQPILSRVIFNAYKDSFVVETPLFKMFWSYNFYSTLIGVLCTAVVAAYVVVKHLKENAAILMRPKAPKMGTKILLERIHFIWNRLSFLHKVTARNMFRYKARMSMTILGIAGCTGLVFLGFAIRDSVKYLIPVQFEELTKYQYISIYDEDLSENSAKEFKKYLKDSTAIKEKTTLLIKNMYWEKYDVAKQTIQLMVPEDIDKFEKMQTLRSPNNKNEIYHLPTDGAIITNKLAKISGVKIGDYIEVKDSDHIKYRIRIAGISENYLAHYIYMSKSYYARIYKASPIWNAKAIIYNTKSEISANKLVSDLLDFDIVLSVAETNVAAAIQTLDSLDIVVGIMIFVSSLLAFVVLYNLTNINISERMRELSTIKVLGFFPKELTAYVYRETFFLSLIGIIGGYGFGHSLHRLILDFIVPDTFQLYDKVFPMTYILSAVTTFIFTLIIMVIVHFRLKRIDMVEALKSYE